MVRKEAGFARRRAPAARLGRRICLSSGRTKDSLALLRPTHSGECAGSHAIAQPYIWYGHAFVEAIESTEFEGGPIAPVKPDDLV